MLPTDAEESTAELPADVEEGTAKLPPKAKLPVELPPKAKLQPKLPVEIRIDKKQLAELDADDFSSTATNIIKVTTPSGEIVYYRGKGSRAVGANNDDGDSKFEEPEYVRKARVEIQVPAAARAQYCRALQEPQA